MVVNLDSIMNPYLKTKTLLFFDVSIFFCIELLKKKKAPGLAKGRKFKKNSDFWMYEKKIRFWIRKTIKKQWFYWFVILLVFFNTCSVAVEHYDQPKWLTEFLGKGFVYFKIIRCYQIYIIAIS